MSLKNRYDNVIIRNNLSLGLSHNALEYVLKLEKENERLKEENFNLREGIYIEKMSFPSEGRNFKDLIEMPTYKQLQNNWNELKKYLECMVEVSHLDIKCLKATLDKMSELERGEE